VLSFYENLKGNLVDLDIAILVNNAGVMFTGPFSKGGASNPLWKDTLDLDVLHVAMMNVHF
jgi:NADP-dependent 3-hydroxy acid dehydrogenase YdfG